MAKVVLISNLKGGVGKTLMTSHLATYLLEARENVICIDADIQHSLYRHRQRDLKGSPSSDVFWEIDTLDVNDKGELIVETEDGKFKLSNLINALAETRGFIFIDCPGNIEDPKLVPLYKCADAVIVPFNYGSDVVDATNLFSKCLSDITQAKLFFLPNNIDYQEERRSDFLKNRLYAEAQLEKMGKMLPIIRHSTIVADYNTLTPLWAKKHRKLDVAFAELYKKLKKL